MQVAKPILTDSEGRARIALVVPALTASGGLSSVARFLSRAIAGASDFDLKLVSLAMSAKDTSSVRLALPSSWLRGATVKHGEWEGFPFVHIGAVATELEFQRYRRRRALTEQLADCQLIQVVAGAPAWGRAVLGLGRPVALQVATLAAVERRRRAEVARGPRELWRRVMTRVTHTMDQRALRDVDAVFVENQWMLDYAKTVRGRGEDRVYYAPPGVDVDFFTPAVRRVSGDESTQYILAVGRLDDPRKNIELLLEAFIHLRRMSRKRPRLKLAGVTGPRDVFWKAASQFGMTEDVTFLPSPTRPQLAELYRHACCLALPSDEEGLGLVALEAMACGVPVVATRCGGPEEIITHGVDGYLVDRGDALGMAQVLRTLVEEATINDAMGMSARRTVEDRFSEEHAAHVFLNAYRSLLNNSTCLPSSN